MVALNSAPSSARTSTQEATEITTIRNTKASPHESMSAAGIVVELDHIQVLLPEERRLIKGTAMGRLVT
jgi:hypothetical protein